MKGFKKKYLPLIFLLTFLFFPTLTHAGVHPSSNPVPTNIDYTKIGSFPYQNGNVTGNYVTSKSGDGTFDITSVFQNNTSGNPSLVGIIKTDAQGNHTSYSTDPTSDPNSIKDDINSVGGSGAYDNYQTSALVGQINQNQQNLNVANPQTGQPQPDCISWPYWNSFQINPEVCIARFISNPLLWISSKILWLAGLIFNFSLNWGLRMKEILDKTTVVSTGWKILRDIANLCFIFILLAIAIGTILQVDSYDVKKLLARVIIVAILLNFSLFFAKVVIDASNILALQFYSKIAPNPDDLDGGVSAAFLDALGLKDVVEKSPSQDNLPNIKDADAITKIRNIIIIGLGGSALMLITAFVLLVGTILFIIRTVVLLFLLILSPVAFLAAILPQTKKYWDRWLGTLLSQSFFAPFFLLIIYIVFASIHGRFEVTGSAGGNTSNFVDLLAGNSSSTAVLYSYILLIGIMLGSLLVAKTFGAYGSDFARNTAGKVSLGLGGAVGRRTIGRAARNMQDSALVKKFAASSSIGRSLEKGLKRTAESSFDARNVGVFSSATGLKGTGKGGYSKMLEDRKKALEDQKKRISGASASEDRAKNEAEDANEKLQDVRANALLDERDDLQENLDQLNEVFERERVPLEANIAAIEADKTAADTAFNAVRTNLTSEISTRQAEVVAALARGDRPAADLAQNQADLARNQLQIATNNHDRDQADRDRRIAEDRTKLQDYTDEQKKFEAGKQEIDKELHQINERYNENGKGNDAVIISMRSKQDEARVYANAIGLGGLAKDQVISATRNMMNENRQVIKNIEAKGRARGESYAKPGVIDRFAARAGITTAQMAMVRDMRNDDRRGSDKKLLNDLKKFMKDSEPKAPTPPPAPPSTP